MITTYTSIPSPNSLSTSEDIKFIARLLVDDMQRRHLSSGLYGKDTRLNDVWHALVLILELGRKGVEEEQGDTGKGKGFCTCVRGGKILGKTGYSPADYACFS